MTVEHHRNPSPGPDGFGGPHKTLEALTTAPGRPGQAYVLESSCGETIYIPCSRSATRLLVTGKESDNAFAVVGSVGSQSAPIGFHFHREAHDVFLCLKGHVNVWANDQCRTLGQGDFASVPPGVVHQYQILGNYTEFVGLIVPGGWEEFFRFIGEPYNDGPLYPLTDDRNVFEVLIPKLKAAAEKFDMVPVPDHPGVEPQPWEVVDDGDNTLPGALEPYFLRAGSGPRYLLGGIVASPLITTPESNNRFSIGSIEGSSWHEKLTSSPVSETLTFNDVHHAFQVADGSMTFALNNGSDSANLNVGETIYIPAGTSFSVRIKSRYAKVYAFISGAGIMDLLCKAGKPYHQPIPPEKAQDWDRASLEALQAELKFRM